MSNLSDFIGADPQGIVKMNAATSFAAGDVMVNNDTGKPTVLSTALGLALETNATAGPQAIRAIASIEATGPSNYGTTSLNAARTVCQLGNGNFAFVYSGNGATDSETMNVRIRNHLGSDVCPRIVLSTSTGCYSYRIFKLNATQFVVGWYDLNTTLKFAVVNNDGTVAVAATTIANLVSNNAQYWNMGITTSGDVVFAYAKSGGTDLRFSRYNSSGVLQGSETTVEASCSPITVSVLGCSNGTFVISYYRGAVTTGYKFARYNSSGVLQGSVVTVFASGSNLYKGDYTNALVELTNGNIVLAYYGVTSYAELAIYNSSNTLVKTVTLDTSSGYAQAGMVPYIGPLDSGGFVVMYLGGSSGYTRFVRFYSGGTTVIGPISFGAATLYNGDSGSTISAVPIGSYGFAVLRAACNAGTSAEVRVLTVDLNGVVKGTETVLNSDSSQVYACCLVGNSSCTALTFKANTATYLSDAYYNVVRKSVLGVAQNSGAANSQALIATKGSYTINQSVDAGGVFDGRSAAVPGTRGMVAGTSAVLFGMQP